MMTMQINPRLPISDDVHQLKTRLYELFAQYSIAINKSSMWDTEGTAAPAGGTWAIGQKCKNTAPSELGSATAKYVIIGWICTASGTPGTWLPMRILTGN